MSEENVPEVPAPAPAVSAEDVAAPKASRPRMRIAIASVAAVSLVYGGMVLAVGRDIPSGTSIGKVPVGGLSAIEARERLDEVDNDFSRKPVRLVAGDAEIKTSVKKLGLSIDIDASIAAAPAASLNPFSLAQLLISGQDLGVILQVQEGLADVVDGLAETVDVPAVNSTITVDYKTFEVAVVPSAKGRLLDVVAAKQLIVDTIAADPFAESYDIELPVVVAEPEVQEADAQEVIDTVVMPAISSGITVTASSDEGAREAFYSKKTIARAMSFEVRDGKLIPHLRPKTIRKFTDPEFGTIQTPVQNATWDVSSGTPVVVPAKDGFGVSDESLAESIESVWLKPEGQRTVAVKFGVIKPTFTTEEAKNIGVVELVSTYKQNFPYEAYRVTNIGQAAEYINGTLLKPGDIFSMNETIKERTYENGYTDGWIIAGGGIFKMEPGGGVSTATTAMFNGAWFAGMEFVEWRAHSVWIPDRYIPGREATVFWGALDMRFKNNHPTGIFITTEMTNTSVTIKFWGTKQWDEIDTIIGEKRNVSQPEVIYNTDPDCHSQTGVIGFRITTYRTFFRDGVEVKRQAFNTSYRPSPSVVCSAKPTKKPSPSPTKTKKPTTSPSPSTSATPA